MMEQPVEVTARDGDIAWVRWAPRVSCGGCRGGGCGAAVWLRWMARSSHALAVRAGGPVRGPAVLELEERWLLQAAVLAYGAPLAGLLGGAVIGHWLAGDTGAIGLGGVGLLAVAALTAKATRRGGLAQAARLRAVDGMHSEAVHGTVESTLAGARDEQATPGREAR